MTNFRELANFVELKSALAILMTWMAERVGCPESAVQLLFYLLLCDLALGISRAWKTNTLRGARITRGAFKFFWYWLAISIFVLVDGAIAAVIPSPIQLHAVFIAYLAINEAFSCIDHLAFFGIPIPEGIIQRLRGYRVVIESWNGEERRGSNLSSTDSEGTKNAET